MRRLAVLVLIGLLSIVGVGHGASSQSPEWADRFELAGGRVEVPEAGYALTFPDDWRIVRPIAADLEALVDDAHEIAPELASALEAGMAGGMSFSLVALGPAGAGSWSPDCNVFAIAVGGQSVDEIVRAEVAGFELLGDTVVGGPDLVLAHTPIGGVWRIDYRMSLGGVERAGSAHYFRDGGSLHVLTCTDSEHPDDGWLSIAETFEFLPRTSESVEHGYRIVWPVGWAAVARHEESAPWQLEHADHGEAVCVLVDEDLMPGSPGWTLEERARQQTESFPDRVRVDVAGLHPSVEQVARIDTPTGSAYLFSTGDRVLTLVCDSRTGPPAADRWLPIAETFEFLPEEE